ncbi:MAG TPA: LiaF domain-containing protein [Kribbella sp.]|nr:LiaF domain-containing protein [Kribbella sp.]
MTPVRIWIGVVLLALGVIGILEATGVDTGEAAKWWPVAVIGLGVVTLVARRRVSVGPVLLIVLGVILLADQLSWTEEDLVGPALLLVLGFAVLFGLSQQRDGDGWTSGRRSSLAMFGSTKVKERSEHFTRADATAIFGGVTLDLREAHIDEQATVDAFAMFGGVEVLVPVGWRISLAGTPIFGGYEDKTRGGVLPADAPVLNVNAVAIFGGVDVANEHDQKDSTGVRPQDRPVDHSA